MSEPRPSLSPFPDDPDPFPHIVLDEEGNEVTESDKPSRLRRVYKWGLRLFAFGIWVAAGIGWYVWWEADKIVDEFQAGDKKEVVAQAAPELDVQPKRQFPGLKRATTYLLIGSDIRTSIESVGRSDTIMLVRVYPKQKAASILSLPRDLYVPIPGYGHNRINAAYSYGGVGLLIKTLREWLGVPINHFFQVDFLSFIKVVDELNGVFLPVDQRYHHVNDGSAANNWAEIDLEPGYQNLQGEDALSFVRFRHLDSDFYRAARQQLFIREVGRQLRAKKGDVMTMRDVIKIVAKGTTSDLDNVSETFKLANTLREIPSDNIVRIVLDAPGTMINGMSVLVPSEEDKKRAIRQWTNPQLVTKHQPRSPQKKPGPDLGRSAWDVVNVIFAINGYRKLAQISERTQNQYYSKQKKKLKPRKVKKFGVASDYLVPDVEPPSLLRAQKNKRMRTCVPEALPPDYHWPSEEAARTYTLAKKPAMAAYATKASGNSILWMWTTWQNPPILDAPNDAVKIKGKTYHLYWESGQLRMVAWRLGRTNVWITNTLRNEVSKDQMLALARSCR